MMYKGKVVIPLFKLPSKKHFKRSNAKPLDLEKEIGDLPLSQSSQDGSTQVHSMQVHTTQPKHQIHKTETVTSKKYTCLTCWRKWMMILKRKITQVQNIQPHSQIFPNIKNHRSSKC